MYNLISRIGFSCTKLNSQFQTTRNGAIQLLEKPNDPDRLGTSKSNDQREGQDENGFNDFNFVNFAMQVTPAYTKSYSRDGIIL